MRPLRVGVDVAVVRESGCDDDVVVVKTVVIPPVPAATLELVVVVVLTSVTVVVVANTVRVPEGWPVIAVSNIVVVSSTVAESPTGMVGLRVHCRC